MAANTILTSVVTGGSNNHTTIAEEVNAYATDFVTQGVVGTFSLNAGSGGTGSFCVNADASPDMGVTVKAGQAYITATPSSQGSQVLRARASADYTTYVINANASGSTKYDWIYLSVSATNANVPSATADNVTSIYTSRSSSNSTDNGTPPTYGILLAVVTVANAASSITNSNISDRRIQASVSTAGTSNTTGWITGLATPNTVTALGNGSYSCVFNSTDLTGTVSNGMRLKFTRLVAAPTQSTLLNGTTQYYSKTTPTGMTFTNNFVVSAWVKLTSYSGTFVAIASRYNLTSGWIFAINANGQLVLQGLNSGGANFSQVLSYQSIPLNKWVHVAAQLDMASFTATPTTSYMMMDGVDVPASVSRGGTNPTSLIQAGDLNIGSYNNGAANSFFPGKIAQVAIYSAKVTQATILASMHQTLVGTETSLISAYSFNNSINDLNANANNLTANGSAVATNADSPFAQGATTGTLEYGIITSNSFSTNTTLTVQVPEGCAIPTSGGVSAVSYSTQAVPYGFPRQKNKWDVEYLGNTLQSYGVGTAGTWYNTGHVLIVPTGEWKLSYQCIVIAQHAGVTFLGSFSTLSTANNTDSDTRFRKSTTNIASSQTQISNEVTMLNSISATTATPYYLNLKPVNSSTTSQIDGSNSGGPTVIRAECAYL